MRTQSEGNIPETQTKANSHHVSPMQSSDGATVQSAENGQHTLQLLANNSNQVRQLMAYQAMANQYVSKQSTVKNNNRQPDTVLVAEQENLSVDGTSPAQLKRRNKRANWNQKQIDQNERLFRRRAERQERYRIEREREEAARFPAGPSSTKGKSTDDDYRQTWDVNGVEVVFSSGHGYRENHHKANKPPSLNIKELGSMNEIELAILRHLFGAGGIPGVGETGERRITVGGQAVEYRFGVISETKIGIGTYYRPD